jgi:hypothetical protein
MSLSYSQNVQIIKPRSDKVFTLVGIYHSSTSLATYSIIYVHIVRVPVEKDKLTVMLFVSVINFYIFARTRGRTFGPMNLIAIGRDKADTQAKTCEK